MGKNYKIVNTSSVKSCCIFCSFNGRWAHNERDFCEKILALDKYEWQNISLHPLIQKSFGKVIFLRDIYMHFYVDGINTEIDSIDKIIEMLRMQTQGYTVTVVRNSSGGFLTIILGIALNAYRCFSFGGQINLYSWRGE